MRKPVEKSTMRKYRFTILGIVVSLVLLSLGSASAYTASLDSVTYNQKVGSYLTLATQATTFQQKAAYIKEAETAITATYGHNLSTTYDSPFYWTHIYSRSIAADLTYLQSVEGRLQVYNQTYSQIVYNSSNIIVVNNWYSNFSSTINYLLGNGNKFGLPSRLQNAYFINYGNPLDYWTAYLLFFGVMALLVSLIFVFMLEHDSGDYYYVDTPDPTPTTYKPT